MTDKVGGNVVISEKECGPHAVAAFEVAYLEWEL